MSVKDTIIRAILPPKNLETRLGLPYTGGFGNVTVYGSPRQSLDFDPGTALSGYQASEVAYRCVDLWASELSARQLVLKDDEGMVKDDPICERFNQSSNDAESAVSRLMVMWSQLEQQGESFIYMDRGETGLGEPQDFIVLMDDVEPLEIDNFTDKLGNRRAMTNREKIAPTLAGFRVKTKHGDVYLMASEVLWVRYPHFQLPWQAMAPGIAAKFATALDNEARNWQINELRNLARPGGVINLGPSATEESAARYKAQLEAMSSGAINAGRFVVVGGGDSDKAGYDRMGLTPTEMSYIEGRGMNGKDICTAYGVPVDLIFGQSTYDNQEAAWNRFWSRGASKCKLVSSEIDRQLFLDDPRTAIFDLRDVTALQENTDAVHTRARENWKADGLTYGQFLQQIDAEPLEDGDRRAEMLYSELQAYIKALDPATGEIKEPEPVPDALAPFAGEDNPPTDEPQLEEEADDEPQEDEERIDRSKVEVPGPVSDRVTSQTNIAALRAYDRHERSLMLALRRHAEKQQRAVLRAVEKIEGKRAKAETRADDPINPDDVFDEAYWAEEAAKALATPMEALYVDSALAAGTQLANEAVEAVIERVVEIMRQRLDVLADEITATTYNAIKDEVLKPGVEAGESIPKLTKRLQDVFDTYKGDNAWRAERIARTEVLGGFNQASYEVSKEDDLIVGHYWQATPDDRTRHSHEELDNEYRPLGERFSNGLLFPGDPSALKPAESINCRCVLRTRLTEEFDL